MSLKIRARLGTAAHFDLKLRTPQASPGLFFGNFKKFREDMDYSYHVNYSPERQRLQVSAA